MKMSERKRGWEKEIDNTFFIIVIFIVFMCGLLCLFKRKKVVVSGFDAKLSVMQDHKV